ncbi:MAG: 16S rRNA (cytosine(1402)-N(4))-methyltransferase RsmH [bacterium]|nr:16S rRNA (cytosine(1402)-N(4))-methyltransferase RsmH [bacterium]
MQSAHIPVLVNEVLSFLPSQGLVVDGTLGGGGHSQAILEHNSAIRVIGIDRDPKAPGQELAQKSEPWSQRFNWLHGSYADLPALLAEAELNQVKLVLLDLGFSSIQLSEPDRGIAFSQPGLLDMRYDQSDLSLRTAADIINTASRHELERILIEYGEERQAKKIVSHLLEHRKKNNVRTTTQLKEFIAELLPAPKRKGIHPATKTFQALRIAVNNELGELSTFLHHVVPALPKGATIMIISFHSLEDRLVKQAWRNYSLLQKDGETLEPLLKVLTKKPIKATETEVRANIRSRSAKMRVAVRI